MKGDFSRRTFDPTRHYRSLLMQQGRVQLDADWNEQAEIVAHRVETEALDLIGRAGGPMHAAGFRLVTATDALTDDEKAIPGNAAPLTIPAGALAITAGRYYVDGILCENDQRILLDNQPDFPAAAPSSNGVYLAYLDVWQRHITVIEEPHLREVALGGPDTATRIKTVWQVRLADIGALASPNCKSAFEAFLAAHPPPNGTMAAFCTHEARSSDPCIVSPSAGYRGLENQLYRVEIHENSARNPATNAPAVQATVSTDRRSIQISTASALFAAVQARLVAKESAAVEIFTDKGSAVVFAIKVDAATGTLTFSGGVGKDVINEDQPKVRLVDAVFKWSRDNGSVVTTINKIDKDKLTVHDVGRDTILGFAPGQWVEITDERKELRGELGEIVQIKETDGKRTITLAAEPTPLGGSSGVNPGATAKLRRWDGIGAIRFGSTDWIELENAVQVQFKNTRFQRGDYWNIPARAATADERSGQIDWLPEKSHKPAVGVEHHYAALGLVTRTSDTAVSVHDCRKLFPPVTELTSFFYLGGDGQEVMPDLTLPAALSLLPADLVVGVSNGQWPVKGARVRFKILHEARPDGGSIPGAGALAPAPTYTNVGAASDQEIVLETAADGTARARWSLGASAGNLYQVRAELLDVTGAVRHLPITFTANRSVASQVAFDPGQCAALQGKKTVQAAIEQLAHEPVLRLLSGDGQDAMPGQVLPLPIQIEVRDHCGPLVDAQLNISAPGALAVSSAGVGSGAGPATLTLTTDNNGVAAFSWRPDPAGAPVQRARVTLTNPSRVPGPAAWIEVTANLSTAAQVAFTPDPGCRLLQGTSTVQQALERICSDGACREIIVTPESKLKEVFDSIGEKEDAHVCFTPGTFHFESPVLIGGKGHLKISGAGEATFLDAGNIEKALVFIECKSVLARDLSGRAGVAQVPEKPGEESPPRHLNGVLTFRGTDRVTVENVRLQSGAGPVRAASAMTVVDAEDVRVRGSTFLVEDAQVGLLLVDVKRAEVVDNVVKVVSGKVELGWLMQNPRYRAGLRRLVLAGLQPPSAEGVEQPSEKTILERLERLDPKRAKELFALIRPRSLRTPQATLLTVAVLSGRDWPTLLNTISEPSKLSLAELKGALDGHIDAVFGALAGLHVTPPVPVAELPGFKHLYDLLADERTSIAAQGIVVAGEHAGDVRVRDNTVRGALQGIHVGLSHAPRDDGGPRRDAIQRLLVEGNTVYVHFSLDEQRDRHGIFVGNAQSLVIENNFVVVERTPLAAAGYIEGIRVFGDQGGMCIIRQNHLVDFDCGVRVQATNPGRPPRLWRVADNFAEFAVDQEITDPSPFE
ncbi:possible Pectine lyase family protein [Sorangium cellulosum So ce56]|uniref:Possible Pectine lyase family protein n=1 Tax=Sorangium cellulosum (strain So ce56) TaxID=448385 RepID=A9FVC3_SORC5|nr:DUF6519 domain-containing protein [Sorangium cellulosum]CAN92260.1 possible Pectine lyase family protein [Sorangium cellulosum So ce56]